jgi:hypothetical protein
MNNTVGAGKGSVVKNFRAEATPVNHGKKALHWKLKLLLLIVK